MIRKNKKNHRKTFDKIIKFFEMYPFLEKLAVCFLFIFLATVPSYLMSLVLKNIIIPIIWYTIDFIDFIIEYIKNYFK